MLSFDGSKNAVHEQFVPEFVGPIENLATRFASQILQKHMQDPLSRECNVAGVKFLHTFLA